MMLLARRVSLLVAFYVFTSAATAHAECAWVLWEENTISRPRQAAWIKWTLHAARQTRADCEAVLDVAWKGAVKLVEMQPRVTVHWSAPGWFAAAFKNEDGTFAGSEEHRFRCFPDTVDPRK